MPPRPVIFRNIFNWHVPLTWTKDGLLSLLDLPPRLNCCSSESRANIKNMKLLLDSSKDSVLITEWILLIEKQQGKVNFQDYYDLIWNEATFYKQTIIIQFQLKCQLDYFLLSCAYGYMYFISDKKHICIHNIIWAQIQIIFSSCKVFIKLTWVMFLWRRENCWRSCCCCIWISARLDWNGNYMKFPKFDCWLWISITPPPPTHTHTLLHSPAGATGWGLALHTGHQCTSLLLLLQCRTGQHNQSPD